MKGRFVLALFSLAFIAAGAARAQGFYVETVHQGKEQDVTRIYYMPRMLKSVDPDGRTSIFRLDKETVYTLDPAKKTYTSMTFEEMKSMMQNARAGMNEMIEKRMATLTPEQRKKWEERMGAMKDQQESAPVTYQVVPAGEHKSISGFACEKYIVKRDGKDFETVWATKQVGGFESIKKDMEDVSARVSSMAGMKRGFTMWFKDLDGFPVETESHGMVSVATKIERKTFPESEFEIPTGYTLDNSRMGGAMTRGK